MPRIRSLKPEHKQHRKVGPLSDRDYRLWIGMITEADDEGRLVADAAQLRVLIFGYHPQIGAEKIEASLLLLAGLGLIRLYVVDSVRYADFPSWSDHQRINRPSESKLPPYNDSVSVHGGISESAVRAHSGAEGSGKERKGAEGSGDGFKPDARMILDFLNEKAGRTFRPVDVNLKLIEARLKSGATVAQCRGVVARKCREWRSDPEMAHYLRPATLFNATKFEQYVGEREPEAPNARLPGM